MSLSLFEPTNERTFTYYDRCAIALDTIEMKAVRLRVKLEILATPLYRSQNLRYPYYKEFFGYVQTFFQNIYVGEIPIHYPQSFIYDCWNQHALLAYQFAIFLQNSKRGVWASHRLIALQVFPQATDVIAELVQTLSQTLDVDAGFIAATPGNIPLLDGSSSFINTFNSPINLLRFRFDTGTVFRVTIQRWTLPITEEGTSVGNPEVADPYDESSPNKSTPAPSGNRAPNGEPYGVSPPPQSPIDPSLDPDDFSNPPLPGGGGGTVALQGWQVPAIAGVQSAGFAVTCPAATLGDAVTGLANAQNVTNLGVKPFQVDAQGRVLASEVLAAFPGFQFGTHIFAADTSCGVTGVI